MDKVKNISLKQIVTNTETNVEGVKLYCVLENSLKQNIVFILEIEGDMSLSSSFLNSSLGNLIDNYGFETLKNHLKLKCNKPQYERINFYLNKYKNLYQN
jgi:hypothetical protein